MPGGGEEGASSEQGHCIGEGSVDFVLRARNFQVHSLSSSCDSELIGVVWQVYILDEITTDFCATKYPKSNQCDEFCAAKCRRECLGQNKIS